MLSTTDILLIHTQISFFAAKLNIDKLYHNLTPNSIHFATRYYWIMAYIFDCRIISTSDAHSVNVLTIILKRKGLYSDIRREIVCKAIRLFSVTLYETDRMKLGDVREWRLLNTKWTARRKLNPICICYECTSGIRGFSVTPTKQTTLVTFADAADKTAYDNIRSSEENVMSDRIYYSNICVINNVIFGGTYNTIFQIRDVESAITNVVIRWNKDFRGISVTICGEVACLWSNSQFLVKTFPGAENIQSSSFHDFTPDAAGDSVAISKCLVCQRHISFIEYCSFDKTCWEHSLVNPAARLTA